MEITLEEIKKKFETLPEDLKWAIMGAKVDDNIIEIGNIEHLNVEQMGQLSLETHMVMLGFMHPDEFESSVQASLGLPTEKTHALVTAVNEKILRKIREKMMKVFGNIEKIPETSKTESVLDKAGINLVELPSTTTVSSGVSIENREDILKRIEKPETIPVVKAEIHPILAQKLSGFSKNTVVETDHSLNNLSSNKTAPVGPEVNKIPQVDPYREKPE